MSLFGRFKNWWNAFSSRDPTRRFLGFGSGLRGGRNRLSVSNIRSVVAAAYNRIAVDVASVDFRHVRLNEEGKYEEDIDSYLNDCLKIDANLDQSSQALFVDIVESLIDEGCVALVPTDTSNNPFETDSYDIGSIRVGKILEWYPLDVKVEVYREETGRTEQIELPKRILPIIENPFYTTMNEPNSTLRRLVRVLNQLDAANDLASSNKLNMLIQLPYTIKSELKKRQVEKRLGEIQDQLTSSDYGIAYTDATEKIVQLNRPLENNLWTQAKELTTELFNQLGLTEKIINGTASEEELINYHDRTIRPFCVAIAQEIERKWLSKTARTQRQSIQFFRDPFKIVPVKSLAEIVDKFTRNEIMSSNEFRSIIGLKPSDDPRADQLINSNLNQSKNDRRFENVNESENKEVKPNEV